MACFAGNRVLLVSRLALLSGRNAARQKVVDAPPQGVSIEQTVEMATEFELLVLFTSTPGFDVDVKISKMMKARNPNLKICFVGPPVTVEPEKALNASHAIDFVIRREFDYQIRDYANGKPIEEIPGASFRKDGVIVNNPEAPGHRRSGCAALGHQSL